MIRHHKFPRSRKFIPSEADSTPINPFMFLDKRVTIMQNLGKKGERIEVRDEWKRRGNNLDKKRERWVGKTIFYVVGKTIFYVPTQSAKQSDAAGHHNACVAICSDAQGLSTIPLSDLFIPSKAAIRVSYLVKDEYKVHQRLNVAWSKRGWLTARKSARITSECCSLGEVHRLQFVLKGDLRR